MRGTVAKKLRRLTGALTTKGAVPGKGIQRQLLKIPRASDATLTHRNLKKLWKGIPRPEPDVDLVISMEPDE